MNPVLETADVCIAIECPTCGSLCTTTGTDYTPVEGELPNPIWMAKFFHDAYERLAPQYGYETRPDTKEFCHESPNGRLMAAVCEEFRKAVGMSGAD